MRIFRGFVLPNLIFGLSAAIMFCGVARAACDAGYHLESGVCVSDTKECVGNLADANGGNIVWDGTRWNYTGCYKTCNDSKIAYGLSYHDGSNWGVCRPETPTYGCHWGYYNDNGESCEVCPAGSWCYNYVKPCPAGYYCPVGIYDPTWSGYGDTYKCPDGYTSDEGAKGLNTCYKSCMRECTPQTCPTNATCTHIETTPTSGIEYYGGECQATATTCPMTFECSPGYYGASANGGTSCADCGVGHYCTGGTHRASCESTIKSDAPTPTSIITLSDGSWSDNEHAVTSTDCMCQWKMSDESRVSYMYQSSCEYGPTGPEYTNFWGCRTGYYATGPLNWGDWYTGCAPCDNAPANAHYTSYSIPSEIYAVESNCPWVCNDGYGMTSDNQCASICTAGITQLKVGGITVPLYAMRQTTPGLNIQIPGGDVCYGRMNPGAAPNAININLNGTTYHLSQ